MQGINFQLKENKTGKKAVFWKDQGIIFVYLSLKYFTYWQRIGNIKWDSIFNCGWNVGNKFGE